MLGYAGHTQIGYTAPGDEARIRKIADSQIWQAHFEAWVERYLIQGELDGAKRQNPAPDPADTYRAVMELTEARVLALQRPVELAESVVPRLAARGLSGAALEAARTYVKGDLEAALETVSTPELERDASALHLRAQLLDERARTDAEIDPLEVIQAYRIALSFDRAPIQAARARVRIAQLFLSIGFHREASATLRPHLEQDTLERPYDLYARLTYIEAAAQARQHAIALAALDALPPERLRAGQALWSARRRADLLFQTKQYAAAADAYAAYRTLAPPDRPDPLSGVRAGFATLQTGQLDAAREILLETYTRTLELAVVDTDATRATDGAAAEDSEGRADTDAADSAVPEATDTAESELAPERDGRAQPTPHGDGSASRRADAAGPELLPLIGLLRVQTEAQSERHREMHALATQMLARYLASAEAPLLATSALEAERLRGTPRRTLEGAAELVDLETRDPAVALLTFSMELIRADRGEGKETIENLAKLARRLPQGPAQALIHDEMAYRLLERVRAEQTQIGRVAPHWLDLMERELSARQMSEDGLLFALEAFRSSGRTSSCARWARALREREVRPLRRGLGAWREVQCRRRSDQEPVSRQELTELADGGTAGPFSLALAALAGEALLRETELESAIRIYERALESFPEPQIVGPVLIRLGELHAAASRAGLARRRLERGLGITASKATAADPFRKLGMLALGKLVVDKGDSARLQQLLSEDIDRVEPWWPSAYRFLAQRANIELPGTPAPGASQDPFGQGIQTLSAGRELGKRLSDVIDAADGGSPTEPGTP